MSRPTKKTLTLYLLATMAAIISGYAFNIGILFVLGCIATWGLGLWLIERVGKD